MEKLSRQVSRRRSIRSHYSSYDKLPLLPHRERYYAPLKGLSSLSASLTLISTLVGAGYIALPYAAYHISYTLAIIMFIAMLIQVKYSCNLYLVCVDLADGLHTLSEISY